MRRGFIPEWAFNIIVLLFFLTTIAQHFVIPTPSMESTLIVGDHVLVDKLAFSPAGKFSRRILPYQSVRRGDIIVFRYPLDLRSMYVKRAIGLPGDRIRIVEKNVFVNGRMLNEPYKRFQSSEILPYRDNFPDYPRGTVEAPALRMLRENVVEREVVVPPAHYFALGDNRDDSADSRYWGFVPEANIVGKPVLIWWSFDAPTEHLADNNLRVKHIADMVFHFFSKTRWSRTCRLVRGFDL